MNQRLPFICESHQIQPAISVRSSLLFYPDRDHLEQREVADGVIELIVRQEVDLDFFPAINALEGTHAHFFL